MNTLNSIILEGTATGETYAIEQQVGERAEKYFGFWVESETQRHGKTERLRFFIRAYGKLGEVCEKSVKKGRGVRVVGCIMHEADAPTDVYIFAEHIEFKPMKEGA